MQINVVLLINSFVYSPVDRSIEYGKNYVIPDKTRKPDALGIWCNNHFCLFVLI